MGKQAKLSLQMFDSIPGKLKRIHDKADWKTIYKVVGSKINVQKPVALIHINNYQVDVLMVDENFVYVVTKKIRCLQNT